MNTNSEDSRRASRPETNQKDSSDSHPIGTGTGAVAGGATGAAVGSAAGPIGTAAGAVAGGVLGAAAGHASAEAMEDRGELQDMSRFVDYTVVDQSGDKVGTVDAVWEDASGQPCYLAVKTGWLGMGRAHLVPAYQAELNETKRRIRVPFTADQIKEAPTFEDQEDITPEADQSIREYFGISTGGFYEDQPVIATDDRIEADVAEAPIQGSSRASDESSIRLKQEELKVGKREVEYGGVRLRKIVRTEIVNQPVELRREEIVVERTPVSDASGVEENGDFSDEEIYIPLRREEPVIQKTVRVTEEVRVGKRADVEQEQISETLRKEDVEIEKEGEERRQRRDYAETR